MQEIIGITAYVFLILFFPPLALVWYRIVRQRHISASIVNWSTGTCAYKIDQ